MLSAKVLYASICFGYQLWTLNIHDWYLDFSCLSIVHGCGLYLGLSLAIMMLKTQMTKLSYSFLHSSHDLLPFVFNYNFFFPFSQDYLGLCHFMLRFLTVDYDIWTERWSPIYLLVIAESNFLVLLLFIFTAYENLWPQKLRTGHILGFFTYIHQNLWLQIVKHKPHKVEVYMLWGSWVFLGFDSPFTFHYNKWPCSGKTWRAIPGDTMLHFVSSLYGHSLAYGLLVVFILMISAVLLCLLMLLKNHGNLISTKPILLM